MYSMNFNPTSNQHSQSGMIGMEALAGLQKALTAGYGTDMASLTGGEALRIQSLDKTMMATIQDTKHFRLFNSLRASQATATVDEWTEQHGIGGFLGHSANSEVGNIALATGEANRMVGKVKYLMTRAMVSLVVSVQNNQVNAEAWEQSNAAKRLLTDAEYLCFYGDSSVVDEEFDGIIKQIESLGSVDHVLNMEATPLTSIDNILAGAATIASFENFGTPTHLFLSTQSQADLDFSLDPAYRVPLTDVPGGGIQVGSPVTGIRTSHGDIQTCHDVFIRDDKQLCAFEILHPAEATANVAFKPATVTPVAASDVSSIFRANHAGDYYYLVTGVNKSGQSTGTISAQVAVAAGEKVTVTIAASTADTETGYVIYRSRKDGTSAVADFRECDRIAKAGATTVWVDYNEEVPGCSFATVLNMLPSDNAINWRQFMPMIRFPLAPVDQAVIPWAQLLFGFLRVAKRNQHVLIKNILPRKSAWRPFG